MIVRGGVKISPEELDDLLSTHADIVEAAVFAEPDTILGEKVCAAIVLRPGSAMTLKDLQEYLKSRGVAVFKWPERLEILSQLPRNPMGKVVRVELARQLLALRN